MDEQTEKKKVNLAYIDGANLNKALVNTLGWILDYKRFRVWLTDKYHVERAYLFIGLIPKHKDLYTYLQRAGFILVFKDVLYQNGNTKGNCDADLLMQASSDFYEGRLAKAILVTSDGDYTPLIKVLQKGGSIETVLSPSPAQQCSILIKRTGVPIAYINDQQSILEYKKKPQK